MRFNSVVQKDQYYPLIKQFLDDNGIKFQGDVTNNGTCYLIELYVSRKSDNKNIEISWFNNYDYDNSLVIRGTCFPKIFTLDANLIDNIKYSFFQEYNN